MTGRRMGRVELRTRMMDDERVRLPYYLEFTVFASRVTCRCKQSP